MTFVPAHFPKRFPWLVECLPGLSRMADRVIVVASYGLPGSIPDGVEWHHVPEAVATGRNYRYALGLAHAGDVVGIMDDDDVWLPGKSEIVRRVFEHPRVGLFAHSAEREPGSDPGRPTPSDALPRRSSGSGETTGKT